MYPTNSSCCRTQPATTADHTHRRPLGHAGTPFRCCATTARSSYSPRTDSSGATCKWIRPGDTNHRPGVTMSGDTTRNRCPATSRGAGDGNRTRVSSLEGLGLQTLFSVVSAKFGASRAFYVPQLDVTGCRAGRGQPSAAARGAGASSVRAIDRNGKGFADLGHTRVGQPTEPLDEDCDGHALDRVHVDYATTGFRVLAGLEVAFAHEATDRGGAWCDEGAPVSGDHASRERATTGRRPISGISYQQFSPRSGSVVASGWRLRETMPGRLTRPARPAGVRRKRCSSRRLRRTVAEAQAASTRCPLKRINSTARAASWCGGDILVKVEDVLRVVLGLQCAKPGKAVAERSRHVSAVRVGFVIDVAPARVRRDCRSGVARPRNAAVLICGVGPVGCARHGDR